MSARRIAAAMAGAAVFALALAPQAIAGTIRYGVAPSPLFTIQDNGNGIVKLTYNGCVTAGARQTISFTMTTTVKNSASAELKVLKEEGQDPSVTITPNPVNLVAGPEQSIPVTIAFTLPSANNGVTTFRFKLDPANGEGLGQGAGIMVRIPCVLAAAPSPNVLANQAPPAPSTAAPVAVPTRAVFPAVGSSLAAPRADCISLPQTLRVRARRTTRLTVRVNANGQNIRHALVRVTLPGGKRIFRRTNDEGVVRLFVRPSRSGTLVIQSDVCFGAARVTVRRAPARRSAAARYTG